MLRLQIPARSARLRSDRRVRRCAVLVAVCLGLLGATSHSLAGDWPSSRLGRPLGDAPKFLVGHIALNGTFDHGAFYDGYGVSVIFRPQAAAEFLDCFYRWNTSLVLQADYQRVDNTRRRILSADIIVRRYEKDMRRQVNCTSGFVGLGFGGSEITIPHGSTNVRFQSWFSWLVEGGIEWTLKAKYILVFKTQFRRYHYDFRNYSGYGVQFHVGFPLPW